MLKDIILEGELLKSKALDQYDPDLSEADFIDKTYDDVKEWIERAKKVLSSTHPNQSIDLDEPSWDSIISRSRGALAGFIENRLSKMKPLLLNTSMTFDRIMTGLLQAYEAHPEMDVEQIIAQVAQELGLGEKSMESIKKSMGMLDKMQEKKESLETAHENCDSTKKWILSETAKMTDSRTDDEKVKIVKAITNAVDSSVEENLNSEKTNKEED